MTVAHIERYTVLTVNYVSNDKLLFTTNGSSNGTKYIQQYKKEINI